MLDHLLGKPSDNIKRLQVGGLLYLSYLIFFTKKQLLGGKLYDKINSKLVKYNPIQIIFLTLSTLYCLKNWLLFIGLGPPNSMAHMYNRNFFRASYIFICSVAGSLTASKLKPKILRDTFGLMCILYYLIFPNQAEERLRLEYRVVKAETMRQGWQVESNMWLKLGRYLLFPRCKIVRTIMIPRAKDSPHGDDPVEAMLLFDGTEEELRSSKSLIFHIPGGGFVCLNPECYASVTNPMGKQTKLPIISFNYKKAPEHPYPYALNELFDAYRTICATNGRCIGIDKLQTRSKVHNGVQFDEINIAITGDSAGGNLTASLTLLILESSQNSTDSYIVPRPKGLVLVYPVLDNNIEVWMNRDNIKQFRQQSVRDLQSLWNTKDHFSHQSPLATYDDTKKWGGIVQKSSLRDKAELNIAKKPNLYKAPSESQLHHIDPLKFPWVRNKQSPIAMGSKLTYFDDRILSGELFRALPIFYLGPNNDSDFINDYFISPLKAPDHLLAQFPKTYFVCGDRDPLVDDTILMAAKIKKAKKKWSKSIHRIRNRKGNEIQKPTPFTNQVALDRNFDGLVIGNDRSSLPNSAYNSSDSESDDDYTSASEGESAFNSTATAVPARKKTMYNRLMTRVKSYVSILQQPPAIPKVNSDHISTAGKDEVHVKIINGVSHGFLNYADFLPEGKAAIKLSSNWLLDLLQEEESEEEEANKAES